MRRAIGTAAGLALSVFLVVALAGCTPDPAPTADASPSVSATPLFHTDAEALAAAKAAYQRYLDVSNEIGHDGWKDTSKLSRVASGEVLKSGLKTAAVYRSKNYELDGDLSFDSIRLESWNSASGVSSIDVYLCLDTTDAFLVNADGSRVSTPERVDRAPFSVSLKTSTGTALRVVRNELWTGSNFC